MLNPEAAFDSLFLIALVQRKLGDAAEGEIHLFSYLACLLAIFDKWPVSQWQYAFAGLENGAPFSTDLHEAIKQQISSGDLLQSENTLTLSATGTERLGFLRSLANLEPRVKYLEAAGSTLRSMPIGLIRTAMGMEPGLRPALVSRSARTLLTESALDQIYDHFAALAQVVGDNSRHLVVPASVWLHYLFETSKKLRNPSAYSAVESHG